MSTTGLPPKMAWKSAGGLDNQSIAFLNTPGIELLYSGVARSSPSAVAMACFNLVTDCGMPPLASRSPSYSGMPYIGNDRRHRITHVVSTVTEVAKARGRKVRSLS
jgi:hypothetical protein